MSLVMMKHKLLSTENLGGFMLVTLRARRDPLLNNYSYKFMF